MNNETKHPANLSNLGKNNAALSSASKNAATLSGQSKHTAALSNLRKNLSTGVLLCESSDFLVTEAADNILLTDGNAWTNLPKPI